MQREIKTGLAQLLQAMIVAIYDNIILPIRSYRSEIIEQPVPEPPQ